MKRLKEDVDQPRVATVVYDACLETKRQGFDFPDLDETPQKFSFALICKIKRLTDV